ncbi:hypothetical protein PS6_011744, partial [Mucor atramentarius]
MVVYILSSSKTSGAISGCFDTLCSIPFAMLFFPGLVLSASYWSCLSLSLGGAICKSFIALFVSGLVLSAIRLKWRYSLVWCCLLQVICIVTFLEFFTGS